MSGRLTHSLIETGTPDEWQVTRLAVWHSGNGIAHVYEVALCRARLVLGWVTVSGFNSRYVANHPGQLGLAIPPWVDTMSTGGLLASTMEETAQAVYEALDQSRVVPQVTLPSRQPHCLA